MCDGSRYRMSPGSAVIYIYLFIYLYIYLYI